MALARVSYPFWINLLRDKQYETSETKRLALPLASPLAGQADLVGG
jgi:hypothetical protein